MLTDEYDRKLRLIEKASEPLRRLGYTDIVVNDDDIRFVMARTEWKRDEIAGRYVREEILFEGATGIVWKSVHHRHSLYDVAVRKKANVPFSVKEQEAFDEYHRFLKENIVAPKDGHDSDEEWIRGGT